MAEVLNGLITITNSEHRTCIVDGKKALFHRWHEFCQVVEAGIAIGSHPAGQIKYTLGTVEFMDGTIHEVAPHKIQFVDNLVEETWYGTTAAEAMKAEGNAENG